MNKRDMIKALQEKRAEQRKKLDAVLETVQAEERSALTDEERGTFDDGEAEIRAIDARIAELDGQIRADEAAAEVAERYAPKPEDERRRAAPGTSVTEQEVYRSGPGGQSYFRDLYLANRRGDREATERLRRNDKMVAEKRAISTTAGAGGEFVPPLWLEDEFVSLARPGRVTADLCVHGTVPAGTNSISIPKVLTGTAEAIQSSQNSAVQQTDMTTGSISSPVVTIAGGQTISMQLVEQSPLNIDDLILADLAADYAMKLDRQVLSGTGTSGQVTGLLTLAGTNSVAWTQATPSMGGAGAMYSSLGAAVSAIHTTRYQPPTHVVMHPRRWAWALAQVDTANRPMVVPMAQGPNNAAGTPGELAAQGRVGEMLGLPVYTDPNLPTNVGAGTNQDVILLLRASDVFLWEGNVRAEAFEQTYAQNLSLFVRLYNYASFQAGRYPASIAAVTGTGSITPAF
ncbi:phage major capsid protein [Streptomyces lydicus]|uniref:phage major capsid protein n=1 Tax=Streptomyces lydicus TaxID=47763 RepID=UPI0010136495|nr:phage major capsid protein [Streptomyces lydicus]MCZ1006336.1 phage major capsid protein [Streptomyces lydicus]